MILFVYIVDKSRRASELSHTHSSHFYEEVFSELIDGLKKNNNEPETDRTYARISVTLSEAEHLSGLDIPFVPPRRSSIRDDSRPIKRPVPAKRPAQRSQSPEVLREMFDLPEEPNRHNSLDNLDHQMLKLSTEEIVGFPVCLTK